jgi:hypothetical protein
MGEDETPFSQVPTPGIGEVRAPYTDPEAHIAMYGAAAKSLKSLPLIIRIVIVVLGIVFVVGLPLVLLLQS